MDQIVTRPLRASSSRLLAYFKFALELIYLATIFLSIILLGATSIEPFLVVAVLMAIAGVLASAFCAMPLRRRPYLYMAGVALGIVALLGWVQSVALPDWAAALLSAPSGEPYFRGGEPISPAPGDTSLAFLGVAFPILALMVGLFVCPSRRRAELWIRLLGIQGACLAFFSLVQFLLFPHSLLFGEKHFYLDSLTGPFINRNSAATYFGITMLVLMHLVWQVLDRILADKVVQRPIKPKQNALFFLYLTMLVIVAIALMLTKSRGGVGSTLVAAIVFVWALAFTTFGRIFNAMNALRRMLFSTLVAFSITILLAMLASRALLRFSTKGLDDARFCVAPSIWRASLAHWWTGNGLGSFAVAFPQIRDASCGTEGIWLRAHNFFLEGFFDAGVLFCVLALTCIGLLAFLFGRTLWKGRSRKPFSMLGLAVLLLIIVHSTVDFSAQIPGIAALCAMIFAAAIVISTEQQSRNHIPQAAASRRFSTTAAVS